MEAHWGLRSQRPVLASQQADVLLRLCCCVGSRVWRGVQLWDVITGPAALRQWCIYQRPSPPRAFLCFAQRAALVSLGLRPQCDRREVRCCVSRANSDHGDPRLLFLMSAAFKKWKLAELEKSALMFTDLQTPKTSRLQSTHTHQSVC